MAFLRAEVPVRGARVFPWLPKVPTPGTLATCWCSVGNEKWNDPHHPTGGFLYSGTKAQVHSMSHSLSRQEKDMST